ncbi:MAG TPA: hypothetical protein VHN58_03740 [Croceicoccus sp.]|nr:hypothetical protein [Croceicoccus sp.]
MTVRKRRRGQPLAALVGVMVMWVAARAWGPVDRVLDVPLPLPPTVAGRVEAASQPVPWAQDKPLAALAPSPVPAPVASFAAPATLPLLARAEQPRAGPAAPFFPTRHTAPPPALPAELPAPAPPRSAPPPPAAIPFGAVPPEARAGRRWSADAWVLWRDKGKPGAALVGAGTYGASQAGTVLRYRILPGSRFDPRAYLRVTTTLTGNREIEGAAGIAVRPVAALPVDLMVEGRALRFFGDDRLRPSETRLRPAAMAVIGPPPLPLPLAARAEAYAQVGYVGGEGSSAFADGQLRIVRDFDALGSDRVRLEAGLGAWGGAQKGVSRVDMGPTAALRFPIGDRVFGRAGIDWRHRAYGDAEPGSGPVITLSAGF